MRLCTIKTLFVFWLLFLYFYDIVYHGLIGPILLKWDIDDTITNDTNILISDGKNSKKKLNFDL